MTVHRRRTVKGWLAVLLLTSLMGCDSPQEKAAEAAFASAQALEAGDPAAARAHILEAVAQRDDVPEYWIALGRAELSLRRFPSAYEAYMRALELDRSNVEALQTLMDLSVLYRRDDEAIEFADQLLLINPQDARARLAKGAVALRRKRIAEALALANEVLKTDPQAEPALVLRAKALAATGQAAPAAEQLELAIRIRGGTPAMLEALLEIYGQARDSEGLQRTYARLIEVRPEDAGLQIDRARELYRSGQVAAGQVAVERLLEARQNDPTVVERAVGLWLQPGVPLLPASRIRELADGAAPPVRSALARYAIESGRPAEALTLLQPLVAGEVTPQTAYAFALYADAHHRLGRHDQARRLAERVLAVEESSPRALLVRAGTAMARGDPARALTDAQLVLRDNPRMAEAHLMLARAYSGLGRDNLATVAYRRAHADFPANAEILQNYVDHLMGQGRRDEAVAVVSEAAREQSGSAAIRAVQARLCRFEPASCAPTAALVGWENPAGAS